MDAGDNRDTRDSPTALSRRDCLRALGGGAAAAAGVGASSTTALGSARDLARTSTPERLAALPAVQQSQYDRVVNLAEAGADPEGNTPCEDIIRNEAADDTLLVLPDGTYRVGALDLPGLSNFGLAAADGANPTITPGNVSGRTWLRFSGVSDFILDGIDVQWHDRGGRTVIKAAGPVHVNQWNLANRMTKGDQFFRVDCEDGVTATISNCHWIGVGPGDGSVQPRATGFYAGSSHAGHLRFENVRIEEFCDNGIYASDPGRTWDTGQGGTLTVDRSIFLNNNVAGVRVGGPGCVIRNSVFGATGRTPRAPGGISARGVRAREGHNHKVLNCDFIYTAETRDTQGAVRAHPHGGSVLVRDCRMRMDAPYPAVDADAPAFDTPNAITVESTTVTGSALNGHAIGARGRPNSEVRDVCISHPRGERDGVVFDSGGSVEQSVISVPGQQAAAAQTRRIRAGQPCRGIQSSAIPDSIGPTAGGDGGQPTAQGDQSRASSAGGNGPPENTPAAEAPQRDSESDEDDRGEDTDDTPPRSQGRGERRGQNESEGRGPPDQPPTGEGRGPPNSTPAENATPATPDEQAPRSSGGENESRSENATEPRGISEPAERPDVGAEFDRSVNIVEDYGADPTGEEPIDAALEAAMEDGTLIEFPEGRYQFGSTGHTTSARVGFQGQGNVVFVPPNPYPPEAPLVKWTGEYAYMDGIDVDIRAEGVTAGFKLLTSRGFYVGNMEFVGRGDHPAHRPGGDNGPNIIDCFMVAVEDSDGVGVIENVVARKGSHWARYGGGRAPVWAGPDCHGTIRVINCHFEEFGGSGIYASAIPGNLQVEGGVYRNNNGQAMRFGGEGSYVEGALIEIDGSKYTGAREPEQERESFNHRGIVINQKSAYIDKPPGAQIRDCDIIVRDHPSPGPAVVARGPAKTVEVLNTRIEVDADVPAILRAGEEAFGHHPPSTGERWVRVVESSIRRSGSGPDVQVEDAPESIIEQTCLQSAGGDSVVGAAVEGVASGDCPAPSVGPHRVVPEGGPRPSPRSDGGGASGVMSLLGSAVVILLGSVLGVFAGVLGLVLVFACLSFVVGYLLLDGGD